MDHGGDIDIILPVLRAWAVVSDAEFERCQSGGHGTWAVIGDAVAVVLFLTSAWLIWAWLP